MSSRKGKQQSQGLEAPAAAGQKQQQQQRKEENMEDDERKEATGAGSPGDSSSPRLSVLPRGSYSPLRDLGYIAKWNGAPDTLQDWLTLLDHTRQAIGMTVNDIIGYIPMLTTERGRAVALGYTARYPQGPHTWERLRDYFLSVMGPALDSQHWRTLKMQPGEPVGVFYGRFLQSLRYSAQPVSDADCLYSFTQALTPKLRAHIKAVEPSSMEELLTEAHKVERKLYHEQKAEQESQGTTMTMLASGERSSMRAYTCFKCGGYGHKAHQCPTAAPPSNRRQVPNSGQPRSRGFQRNQAGLSSRGRGIPRGRGQQQGRNSYGDQGGQARSDSVRDNNARQLKTTPKYRKAPICQLCRKIGHEASKCQIYEIVTKPQDVGVTAVETPTGGNHVPDPMVVEPFPDLKVTFFSDDDEKDIPEELLTPRNPTESDHGRNKDEDDDGDRAVLTAPCFTAVPTCRVSLLQLDVPRAKAQESMKSITAAVDTGAAVSLICEDLVPSAAAREYSNIVLRGADNAIIKPRGKTTLKFSVRCGSNRSKLLQGDFLILESSPYDMVLGMDFLQRQRAVFRAGPSPTLTLAGPSHESIPLTMPDSDAAMTADPQRGASEHVLHSPLLLVAPLTLEGQFENIVQTEVPKSQLWRMAKQEGYVESEDRDQWYTPLRVAYGVTELTRTGKTNVMICNPTYETVTLPAGFPVAQFAATTGFDSAIIPPKEDRPNATVTSREACAIFQEQQAGDPHEHEHRSGDAQNSTSGGGQSPVLAAAAQSELADKLPPIHIDAALSGQQRQQLTHLILSSRDVFALPGKPPPSPKLPPYEIQLQEEAHPIRDAPRRRLNPVEARQIQAEVSEMQKAGVVRRSHSPWASELVLVRKRDGGLRFCVDYRKVNQKIVGDAWPMRRVADIFDCLQGPRWFSTLDIKNAFWSVPLTERSKAVTAFRTPEGLFEFNVLPFGMKIAPAAFQRCMDFIVGELPTSFAYMDDIICFSRTWPEHLMRLKALFERLRAYNIRLNPAKCKFGATKLEYLGHVISRNGIEVQQDKVVAIKAFETPRNVAQLRSFLGLGTFVRRFIFNFARRARPLYRLLKQAQRWKWGDEEQRAFEDIKQAATETTLLAHPDWREDAPQFVLDVDSSRHGVGAVLLQGGRPIAFWSRAFSEQQSKYSAAELELFGVMLAVTHFRPYLFHRKFCLRCDHRNLRFIIGKESRTGRVERWTEILAGYDFEIKYRPKESMRHVDALSRAPHEPPHDHPDPTAHSYALITTRSQAGTTGANAEEVNERSPATDAAPRDERQDARETTAAEHDSLHEVREAQRHAEFTNAIRTFVETAKLPVEGQLRNAVAGAVSRNTFKIEDGVLYKIDKERKLLVIPKQLQPQVLHAAHRHRGRHKMLNVLKPRVWWPRLAHHVAAWTRCCSTCQKNRSLPRHGLLQHVVPPQLLPFRRICADICGPMAPQPTKQGHSHLLVIACMSSRWVDAYPLASAGDHKLVADRLLHWITNHGVPEVVHSDQGPAFMAQALAEAYRQLGITRSRTTPYHPAGDPAERVIGALVRTLRALCQDNAEDWDEVLPIALMALRSHINDTTGTTPYYLVHGTEMRLPVDELFGTDPATTTSTPLHGLSVKLQRLRERVARYEEQQRARYKESYDRNRECIRFKVGNRVLLHFPNIPATQSRKLTLHWRGPYTVLKRFEDSPNMYCVGDESNRDIQVVNVRRMRKYFNLPSYLTPPSPGPHSAENKATHVEDDSDAKPNQEFDWTVECLMDKKRRKGITYYLVRWAGVDQNTKQPYDPSWEPEHHISQDLVDDYERLRAKFRRR